MEMGATNIRTIKTTRFGALEIPRHRVLVMEKPVLGFENNKEFVALKTGDMHPFVWLQSLSDPDIAFLMINPKLLYPDYTIDVNKREVEDIELTDESHVEIFVIVTVGATVEKSTVNLQGPIVINTRCRKAKQLVLANSQYSVSAPLQAPLRETRERDTATEVTGATVSV